MSLLGIDLGSSSVKGVAFDYEGNELAKTSYSYLTIRTGNHAEADADGIWAATQKVIKDLAKNSHTGKIKALAISSHGETIIPVDQRGKAVGKAIMNSDNRADKEIEHFEKELDKRYIYKITGLPLHTMFAVLKVMWLKKNAPKTYEKSTKFLSAGDYVLAKLGVQFYTDYSLANRTMGLDIHKLEWSDEILDVAGLKKEQFPKLIASGTNCGNIPAEVAKPLGLDDDVVIAMGGHDQPCGALGAGAYRSGDTFISAGTYECLSVITDMPKSDNNAYAFRMNSYPHVVGRKYINLGFFPAGFATSWFIDEFCYQDKVTAEKKNKDVFQYISGQLEKNPSGHYFLPYLVGSGTPYWDAQATGALLGITPSTNRHSIFKSIFEGIAFELKLNIDNLESIIGRLGEIMISGGNSLLDFSVQLRSNVTGKRMMRLNTVETVCKGAAMLAGIATGVYQDEADAVFQTNQKGKVFEPDEKIRKAYEKRYNAYREIYHAIKPIR